MKKVLTVVMAFVMIFAIAGCGKKSDEELIQGKIWHLEEVSSELPDMFPKKQSNDYLKEYFFNVEFLSDGSVIINAKSENRDDYESVGYYSYSLVDGRLKISAPLGTTKLVGYEISKNDLKITDGENYAVFKPYDEKADSAGANEKADNAADEKMSVEAADENVTEEAAEDEGTEAVEASQTTEVAEVSDDMAVTKAAEVTEVTEASDDTAKAADPANIDYAKFNNGMNLFWSEDDVRKLWEANKYGPGCYQYELGVANEDFAWSVVEGYLHTTINVKLKDGYSFADIKDNEYIKPEMLDVTITNAHYSWGAQEEGESDYDEPLPDVTVEPENITINNPCFDSENPYIQLIIPDMYNAYQDVEAGQFYVVNWEYGKQL